MLGIPTSLVIVTAVLSLLRFENQRFYRFRSSGRRGSNPYFGIFVDYTFVLAQIFSLGFFLAIWYEFSFLSALILLSINFLISIFSSNKY